MEVLLCLCLKQRKSLILNKDFSFGFLTKQHNWKLKCQNSTGRKDQQDERNMEGNNRLEEKK